MSKKSWEYDPETENVHGAATPADCRKMAQRNKWKLKDIVKAAGGMALGVDCVFEGPQTSFMDETWQEENGDD